MGVTAQRPEEGRADGMFTNKSDMTIDFYQEMPDAYLKSNAGTGLPDNLQKGKKQRKAGEVLEELKR